MTHALHPVVPLSHDLILELDAEYVARYGLFDDMAMLAAAAARSRTWMQLDEFVAIASWKLLSSGSTAFEKATPEEIRTRTQAAFAAHTSELIALDHLDRIPGIGFRAATAFMHVAFNETYPLLDQRVLRSLGFTTSEWDRMKNNDKLLRDFWPTFADTCRSLAAAHHVTLRQLDRALWWVDRYSPGARCRLMTESPV